jgi:hypothetical protein
MKLFVVIQPPKARRGENNEFGALLPQPFQFRDGFGVVGRRPPILALFFKKRDWISLRKASPPLGVIHQNKTAATGNGPLDGPEGRQGGDTLFVRRQENGFEVSSRSIRCLGAALFLQIPDFLFDDRQIEFGAAATFAQQAG